MPAGYLALVLHAHLPFVRHPEHPEFFEEDWLFEAITESYIPLLNVLARLERDAVPCKLAMSITPPLCAMLQDELLQSRYIRHLDRSIDLSRREIDRTLDEPELQQLAQFYFELLTTTRRQFVDEWNRDLLARFRHFRDGGVLEIIASAATHGLLPLLSQSPQAVRAQVLIGCDVYRSTFGADPVGFWLPECAYSPEIEPILQEANVRWFIVDAHGLMFGKPRPRRSIYSPCFTPAGPAVFARDPESSRQVWSAQSGYPGDAAYRDFYRDVGFDLPREYVAPGSTSSAARFTGIKYHRTTGGDGAKQIYERDAAERVAKAHADHFLESRRQQFLELGPQRFDPIVTMPFDAELFGHWWFEGPQFLESFIRKAAAQPDEIRLTTPGEYLASHATHEVVAPAASSWGNKGYWGVWLDDSNSWIYPHLHAAARRMTEVARAFATDPSPLVERGLRQLARELLLAQSSDWAFLIHSRTAKHYAAARTKDHIGRFNKLHEQLKTGFVDEGFLSECEARDNLFPDVDWRHYL
jgi:1,4-alpha-glucan branching enzyme